MGTYQTVAGRTHPGATIPGRVRDGSPQAGERVAEDRALAGRAARDDPRAFERLVRRHSGLVYRVALRVLGPARAPDASQEVWIKVWRNLERFRGESAFTTWLYRIAMNTCLTGRDREARRSRRELREQDAPPLPTPRNEADPETAALNSERRDEIGAALEHVRADHRAALVLRHMEGLPYAEVAVILDVPVGTAKGWASRGRAAMLRALNPPG